MSAKDQSPIGNTPVEHRRAHESAAPREAPQAKPWVRAIRAYEPGRANDGSGRSLVKLSANENPLGTSARAIAARRALGEANLYPDPGAKALREALGRRHDIDPSRIVCGTGSDELLNLAAQGFAGVGDEVLYARYSFSVYEIAARRCGATPIEADDRDYASDVDALLDRVSARTRVVFVANPNNPTGSFLGRAQIARLHAGLPRDVVLVVDQAYAEYLDAAEDDGALALARQHDNVLVTRTFSKIYGLAGERVGWATGSPLLIDALNRLRGPFNVTASAQAMALAALDDEDFVEFSRRHNRETRARFVAQIEALGNRGLRALPSKANFVMVLFEGDLSAERAQRELAQAGYAVRRLESQGLGHGLRITIGKREDMDRIAKTLAKSAGEAA